MRRRGFLKLLGLLPFAPALAEAAAKTINKPQYMGMDLASGSDQTSIWLMNWGDEMHCPPTLLDVARSCERPLLPVVEVLSQKNHLLQDVVWREPNPMGHCFTKRSKWR